MSEYVNPKYKEDILKAMEYHFPGAKVWLFGSRAWGPAKEGSDIDIAVDAGELITPQELWRARATLDHLYVPVKIDLVDMNSISDQQRAVITSKGILL